MGKIENVVWKSIESTVCDSGFEIYDIEYAKEGTNLYLRIYIDKNGGVDINDCEEISRKIEPIIDTIEPIKEAYFLEVSSPGIERKLTRSEHFEKNIGSLVEVSMFKSELGLKKVKGFLKKRNTESTTIEINDKEIDIDNKNISLIKTVYEFEKGGN